MIDIINCVQRNELYKVRWKYVINRNTNVKKQYLKLFNCV